MLLEASGKLYIGCNGHIIVKKNHKAWHSMVNILNSGKTFQVGEMPECLKKELPKEASLESLKSVEIQEFLNLLWQCHGIESN